MLVKYPPNRYLEQFDLLAYNCLAPCYHFSGCHTFVTTVSQEQPAVFCP